VGCSTTIAYNCEVSSDVESFNGTSILSVSKFTSLAFKDWGNLSTARKPLGGEDVITRGRDCAACYGQNPPRPPGTAWRAERGLADPFTGLTRNRAEAGGRKAIFQAVWQYRRVFLTSAISWGAR